MKTQTTNRLFRLTIGIGSGSVVAMLASYSAFRLQFNLPTAGFIALLIVVLIALKFGFWENFRASTTSPLASFATSANVEQDSQGNIAEGIAELKFTSFNNNAEFSQVGDVTFTTKAGTNDVHGSLFEYLQNDAFDARVLNFNLKAPKRFNTFGGSFGGPVQIPKLYNGKDKTFFFFDYEGNRRITSQPEQYLVPTMAQRARQA